MTSQDANDSPESSPLPDDEELVAAELPLNIDDAVETLNISPITPSGDDPSPTMTPAAMPLDRVTAPVGESDKGQKAITIAPFSRAEQQERTRSWLALGIAIGIGVLMYLILGLDFVHRRRLYQTIDNLMVQGQSTSETVDKLLELKKEQAQASHALMTLLITANFSALGTALGFYFGSSNRDD